MTDAVNTHIMGHRAAGGSLVVPALRFANGLDLSVQASSIHYCSPRADEGPWSRFEVGQADHRLFPELRGYRGDPEDRRDVHGYVPREVIEAIITRLGLLEQGG